MKILKMKWIRARNFMCYGNEWVRFDIKNGITQIVGENGNGKSTIFEIMHFVLFNSAFRPKITKSDLINDQNMKQLEAEMGFDIIDEGMVVEHIVSRGIKPDYFKIIKDGIMQNTASTAVNQEALKSFITSISEGVFKSSIGLSPITVKPIIEMTPEERRNASSEMFSMKDIDLYRDNIKSKISASKLKEVSLTSKIQALQSSILSFRSAIESIDKNNQQAIQIKKEQLLLKESEYATIYSEYMNKKSIYDELYSIYSSCLSLSSNINKVDISNKIAAINSSIYNNNIRINTLESKKINIKPGTRCLACKEKLSESSANEHILEIQNEIDTLHNSNASLSSSLEPLNTEYTKAEKEEQELQEKKNNSDSANSYVLSLVNVLNEKNSAIQNIKLEIANMESNIANSYGDMQTSLEKAELEYNNGIIELNDLRLDNEVNVALSKVFADDGLKAYVISNYMNNFNSAVNKYLGIIGLPVSITFNEKFDHVMSSGIGVGKKYHSLSTGQRQRLNLAIALSVVDLTMAISRFKCSVLFLDEIADVGMDDSGMSAFLGIIKAISERDDKSIILISHKNMDSIKGSREMIDNVYEAIRIDGNFSSLVEVSNKNAAN